MKKVWLLLIVIVALCSSVYYWYVNHFLPRVVSVEVVATDVVSCVDSDSGDNMYLQGVIGWTSKEDIQRGFVSKSGASKHGSTDYCSYEDSSRKGVLIESACDAGNNTVKRIKRTCGYKSACREGACVSVVESLPMCTDTDNGDFPYVKGRVYAKDAAGGTDDSCVRVFDRRAIKKPVIKIGVGEDGPERAYTDKCIGEGCYVEEYFCRENDDFKQYVLDKCLGRGGCVDGACVR